MSGSSGTPGSDLLDAVAIMDRLRSPGGCPWDAEQTHASLAPYAVEEAHELAEAAESGDDAHLREELGDLLLQVLFHARIASERPDGFDIDDVARTLVDKLTYRHPHVFADDGDRGLSAQQVTERWDDLKATRQQRISALDGIPASLPALARAQKVLHRLDRAGVDASGLECAAVDGVDPEHHLGRELLAVVRRAADQGIDAEAALRSQIRGLEAQVREAESRSS